MASTDKSQRRSGVEEVFLKNAEEAFQKLSVELQARGSELTGAIQFKCDAESFKIKLNDWMVSLEDYKFAEKELRRWVHSSEKEQLKAEMAKVRTEYREIRAQASIYLDELLVKADEEIRSVTGSSEAARNFSSQGLLTELQNHTASTMEVPLQQTGENGSYEVSTPQHGERPPFLPPRDSLEPRRGSGSHSATSSRSSIASQEEANKSLVVELTSALKQMTRRDKLLKIEPTVFSGDMLDYPAWWASFQMLLQEDDYSEREKLLYLDKYTSGDVNSIVRGFMHQIDNPMAYQQAQSIITTRYGDRVKIADAFRRKIRDWPGVRKGDPLGLRRYADFLWQCLAAMSSVGFLGVLEKPEENARMSGKLPHYLAERWNRIVVDRLYGNRGPDQLNEYGEYPSFKDFCMFVSREAQVADGPCVPRYKDQTPVSDNRNRRNAHTFKTGVETGNLDVKSRKIACYFCKQDHYVDKCKVFLDQSEEKKSEFERLHRLCYHCFKRGHRQDVCRSKTASTEPTKPATSVQTKSMKTEASRSTDGVFTSTILPVVVSSADNPERAITTYAVIDSQSDSCFLSKELQGQLSVRGPELTMTTMNKKSVERSQMISGLVIRGIREEEELKLPACYTQGSIPADRESIPRPEHAAGVDYLQTVAEQMFPYQESWSVGLLIGVNCLDAFFPEEVAPRERKLRKRGEQMAIKTMLGSSIMGGREAENPTQHRTTCRKTAVAPVELQEVKRAFDLEFTWGDEGEKKASVEDLKFIKLMEEKKRFEADGHVSLPLPIKDRDIVLPDCRPMAMKRLMTLRNRFRKDPGFQEKYVQFMKKLFNKDYAEMVDGPPRNGQAWYMPHQGVVHPRKPDTVRVVFDGSAQCEGVSLNSCLMSGPDLCNSLLGVLMRFRKEKVAFSCDVEAMFLQIRVHEEDRDWLRFLWFKDHDPEGPIVECRVKVYLFGAASSPACATYAFREVAETYEGRHGQDAAEFIKKNFYVDDGLKSEEDEDTSASLMKRSHELCKEGGLNLTKYISPSANVMKQIPEEIRAPATKIQALEGQETAPYPALGMNRDLAKDAFRYFLKETKEAKTRRAMLSTLSSVYDPLGLISPLLLPGRSILQELCQQGLAWDVEVPTEYQQKWDEWYESLKEISDIVIPRCYKKEIEDEDWVDLHFFSDASNCGFGACCYLVRGKKGMMPEATLVCAKLRVKPIKNQTIPRMELQAAVMAVKMKISVVEELDIPVRNVHFWSDSKIVYLKIAYISNLSKRFHLFVTNRVIFIRDNTQKDFWHYIPTDENPADIASRGSLAVELKDCRLWWEGPTRILCEDPGEMPREVHELPENDPEIKRDVWVQATAVKRSGDYLDTMREIGTWKKMVGCTAVWLRYMEVLNKRIKKEQISPWSGVIDVSYREEAITQLTRLVQRDELSEEYYALKSHQYLHERDEVRDRRQLLKSSSNLFRLDVYMDTDSTLRVGGRLRRGDLSYEAKHPRVVPQSSFLAKAIMQDCHEKSGHSGQNGSLGRTRGEGWWILRGKRFARKICRDCVGG